MKKNGQKAGGYLLAAAMIITLLTLPSTAAVAQEKQETVFEEAAVMPQFQGGDVNAFRNWVMTRIKYPEEAKKKGVTGKVFVGFIVEKDGSVSNVKVKKGVPEYFDEEVIRVIKSSPNWTPGKNESGETVRVSFVITVDFKLS